MRYGEIPGTGQVQRILFNENMQELRREVLLADLRQRVRDVKMGPDELLYVVTATILSVAIFLTEGVCCVRMCVGD
jgi:hypothetical protein